MLSRTAEYALRALSTLAALPPDSRVQVKGISDQSGVPRNYLGKILGQLGRAGIVLGDRGRGGGFTLARPASSITAYDIVSVFDDLRVEQQCLLSGRMCGDPDECSAHARWSHVLDTYEAFLRDTTLAELGGGQGGCGDAAPRPSSSGDGVTRPGSPENAQIGRTGPSPENTQTV